MNEYRIGVETQPTTAPKPKGFGILANGHFVAFLTEEQLREALKHFDELKAQYEASRFPPV